MGPGHRLRQVLQAVDEPGRGARLHLSVLSAIERLGDEARNWFTGRSWSVSTPLVTQPRSGWSYGPQTLIPERTTIFTQSPRTASHYGSKSNRQPVETARLIGQ